MSVEFLFICLYIRDLFFLAELLKSGVRVISTANKGKKLKSRGLLLIESSLINLSTKCLVQSKACLAC